jgi:hypothetical protein
MTIIEYLLIGSIGVAAIYTVCRLFVGWRNSTFLQGGGEMGSELEVPAEPQPSRHVRTRAPWKRCEEARD